jgi:copper(I)-binding protein
MNSTIHNCSPAARWVVAGLGMLVAAGALAADPIKVDNAWIRTVAPGTTVSAIYMNATALVDLTLVGVETPIAAKAELHESNYKDGVKKMRAVKKLEIPAGKIANMEPGGFHVMLFDVNRELKDSEQVPVTLLLETKGVKSKVTINAEVRFVPVKHEHMPQK